MSLFEQLGNLAMNVVYAILYPFISFINVFINAFITVIGIFTNFWTALNGLWGSINGLLQGSLLSFIDNAWSVLILLQIGLILMFRIYYFVKDIEILGNKV